jgi:hypothetical protein
MSSRAVNRYRFCKFAVSNVTQQFPVSTVPSRGARYLGGAKRQEGCWGCRRWAPPSVCFAYFTIEMTAHHTLGHWYHFNKLIHKKTKQLNSVALVRELTIPIELPPLVGKVSVNVCG